VIPSSPKKSLKKSTQKKPIAPIKSVPSTIPSVIPALSFNLTLILATILFIAKELEATTLKPPIIAPELSIIVPYTIPTTTYSERTIKRHSG